MTVDTSKLRNIKPVRVKAEIKMPTAKQIKAAGSTKAIVKDAFVVGSLRGSSQVERELPTKLSEAMASSVWGPFSPKYPYYRKNGELVGGGNRDLIDTGRLHDSLKLKTSFMATKTVTQIEYTAPYAALVHYGGAIQPYGNPNLPTVLLPGRPWITSLLAGGGPIEQYNINAIYEKAIQESFKS